MIEGGGNVKVELPVLELKRLYIGELYSRQELAEHFNTTLSIVGKRLRENGIQRTPEQEQRSRERTMLKKYGVSNPAQLTDFRDKSKQTFLDKYGVDNPSKLEEIQRKKEETTLRNYGVRNPSQSEEVRERAKTTLLNNYGVEYPYQNEEIKAKFRNSVENKYVVSNFSQAWRSERTRNILQSPDMFRQYLLSIPLINRTIKFILKDLDITDSCLRHYIQRYDCMSLINFYTKSSVELELWELLNSWGIECYRASNLFQNRMEVDIYIPKYNLGIEYNGNFYHSYKPPKYHQNKSLLAKDNGVFIFHIFEYEWVDARKHEILIGQLKNLLGLNKNRIGARACEIYEISGRQCSDFLNENHLQGKCPAETCLGLFHEQNLISVMSFGKARFGNDGIELLRFCNKLDYTVTGGASKLFKYYIQKYKPERIISFCNIAKGKGTLYQTLGFTLDGITSPNYVWVKGSDVKSRYQCQMPNEREVMLNRGYLQIFDCGNYKFSYKSGKK